MTSDRHIADSDIGSIVEALVLGDTDPAAFARRVIVRFATALAARDGGNTSARFDAIHEWAKRSAAELDELLRST